MIKLFLNLLVVLLLMQNPLAAESAQDKSAPKKKEEYTGKPAARMIYYTGQVQGVGFRATAERIAQDFPVTGWVKNLADGRVQIVVEGPIDGVEAFLKAVRTHWGKNIEKERVDEQAVSGKFKGFKIEY